MTYIFIDITQTLLCINRTPAFSGLEKDIQNLENIKVCLFLDRCMVGKKYADAIPKIAS